MIVIILSFTILNISSQVSAQPQESNCNIISKSLNSKQASQFEYNFNTIRNQVAMGRRANHKGQIQPASDMHIATWSQELAKLAQECSETCPEHPLNCRNQKAQQGFLIYKQLVHTEKWNIDPYFILNEWMQSKQSSQQLLQSMLFQIGCGRAMSSNLGEYVVYVVCYFDYVWITS
ncbi:unnamed protein product (macronuclear) [Paramecium tetraurelia]|uniref:SCP domain-containing protein n=1 Tax=Paramecium tetraurelia TaxID=5888 RepID=A0D489_PARTE|nr:uncharacterized protein GSPATT00013322001 [Paramecium tetraurelia]CAK77856.1 unnamed protein product [Paramecium tetraurelia]|eukprot:XP_001445253.1 hypothetical protein (macronuclear) [Paramecium tetraurelia strain d4-2]